MALASSPCSSSVASSVDHVRGAWQVGDLAAVRYTFDDLEFPWGVTRQGGFAIAPDAGHRLIIGRTVGIEPAMPASGQGRPYQTYAFGAHIAEVDVDPELGTVKVRRIVAAHDVGRAINPTQVEALTQPKDGKPQLHLLPANRERS